ncbi:hypothetical protein HELRODRAFT_166095 [Helobdella robusta]|uniref:Uncharacterized protein n=1 Tax=Helobdella robusta TaxID=6412 RepID=T1EXR3_HELRO|nr:hypothetical protein HELRODRAFT_166095 [Helobdella robusta]ESN90429.1 hypothetical protein HELRODRAFT_166095 [Helobdella robusta]
MMILCKLCNDVYSPNRDFNDWTRRGDDLVTGNISIILSEMTLAEVDNYDGWRLKFDSGKCKKLENNLKLCTVSITRGHDKKPEGRGGVDLNGVAFEAGAFRSEVAAVSDAADLVLLLSLSFRST